MSSVPAVKKKRSRKGEPPLPRRDEAWIGGFFSLRAFVREGDDAYRPEAVVWMTDRGLVLSCTTLRPGDVVACAVDSFESTAREPREGEPGLPARVRVASPALADALRARLGPGVDVRVAPTPEIDAVAEDLEAHLGAGDGGPSPSFLGGGIEAPAMASFFRAAAALHRAAPWEAVPSDTDILSLSIPSLGARDLALCVLGQAGQGHGVLLFESARGFELHLAALEAPRDRPPTSLPAGFFSLSFDRASDLHPALRAEVAEQRWELVGPDAVPTLAMVDEDLLGRKPTPQELTASEALALGLVELMKRRDELAQAFRGGAPVEASYVVETHGGPVEVMFRAPHPERG
ncbi:hypothetical protein SOCEGT47_045290 [Sorangium cellulosum]|jgi:hypothetical protein|uniref:Uncharacterized protein n=1 Tax=Sorangium cellulosum TaxID=56 RepID=A0A4P2Q4Q9_SORCE|nr:hypothetical protein [Sorangium cellulosum]AUX23998.1 hypothetical protein SOCEGT47_045290 [Sorangium cellulosum]